MWFDHYDLRPWQKALNNCIFTMKFLCYNRLNVGLNLMSHNISNKVDIKIDGLFVLSKSPEENSGGGVKTPPHPMFGWKKWGGKGCEFSLD